MHYLILCLLLFQQQSTKWLFDKYNFKNNYILWIWIIIYTSIYLELLKQIGLILSIIFPSNYLTVFIYYLIAILLLLPKKRCKPHTNNRYLNLLIISQYLFFQLSSLHILAINLSIFPTTNQNCLFFILIYYITSICFHNKYMINYNLISIMLAFYYIVQASLIIMKLFTFTILQLWAYCFIIMIIAYFIYTKTRK